MKAQLAVLGECMLELKPGPSSSEFDQAPIGADIRYGGDTLNCSVYLSRCGVDVSYATALGDDPLSNWMINQWKAEGIRCDLVYQVNNTVPGMYLIDTDACGERSFYYWRDQAPVRALLDDPDRAQQLFNALASFPYVYLSGITLALFDESIRQRIYSFLDNYRSNGGKVCFDNNFRPRQWRDSKTAKVAFTNLYQRTDIALPTLEDEQLLYPAESEQDTADRLLALGIPEIVLKKGAHGCRVIASNTDQNVAAVPLKKVIDSTAAGDSFNAGYLAARLAGHDYVEAAQQGAKLAAMVVQFPGAIIPKNQMPI